MEAPDSMIRFLHFEMHDTQVIDEGRQEVSLGFWVRLCLYLITKLVEPASFVNIFVFLRSTPLGSHHLTTQSEVEHDNLDHQQDI
jgi:hypothetical protein